jgi:hypothetical protein
MAAIPQSPKGQSFLPKRGGVLTLRSGHSARATKRLLAGIIDCAFEIAKMATYGIALPTAPDVKFFACAATLDS